jgi:hypothetical protein
MEISKNIEPVLIIRLGKKWKAGEEEIETGYFRQGKGWHPNLTDTELADAVRAWWKVSPVELEKKGIEHIVAYADGLTRALYRIESVLGPRAKDGRVAFQVTRIKDGELFQAVIGDEGLTVPFRRGSANPVKYWQSRASAPSNEDGG